jgi:hypothetical protein
MFCVFKLGIAILSQEATNEFVAILLLVHYSTWRSSNKNVQGHTVYTLVFMCIQIV